MLVETPDITVESTITGQKIAMTMDADATAHLMAVLTKLYSDPTLAVIREYATNGYDSHVAAGQTRPIEVTLPNNFNPEFKVQDFGLGMDADDIADTYSKYGASTKRNSNEFNGMLGLGCKSALAYADMFTVVGVKNGISTTVVVARDEDGACSMTIASESVTNAPNGVTVSVPVERYNKFAQTAANFFRFWKPGTVLVNGQEPKSITGLSVSDNMMIVPNLDSNYVIMGNVAYPASIDTGLNYGHKLVVTVPIGTVKFTPAREALEYTAKTRAAIEMIQADLKLVLQEAIQTDIDKATTYGDALKRLYAWKGAVRSVTPQDFTYSGTKMPPHIGDNSDTNVGLGARIFRLTTRSGTLSHSSNHRVLDSHYIPTSLFVHGYELENFTAAHKKKLNIYADQNGIDVRAYVLTADKFDSQWIENRADWADIAAIKLPTNRIARPKVANDRPKGSYDIKMGPSHINGVPADEIITKHGVYYMVNKVYGTDAGATMARLLTQSYPDATLVYMASNRVNKFKRDFPMAVEISKALKAKYNELSVNISQRQLTILKLDREYYVKSALKALNVERLKDPELIKGVKLAQAETSDRVKALQEFGPIQYILGVKNTLDYRNLPDIINPLDAYPMFSTGLFQKYPDDMYLYLNAAFAANRKASK